jgi:hypothetical protein
MLLHTTAPATSVDDALSAAPMLVLCCWVEADIAYTGVDGIAATTSAAIRTKLNRRWENLVVFIGTILLLIVGIILDRPGNRPMTGL